MAILHTIPLSGVWCAGGSSPRRPTAPCPLLTPLSEAGRNWIDEQINPEATRWGFCSIVIEHRSVGDVVGGLSDAGLSLSQD